MNESDVDRQKSEFLSTVSHELRTPLTSIGGYIQLITAGDAGPLTDTQREFLSIVEANVRRLTALINDVLDMERMESGAFQVKKEPQRLGEILHECYESLLLMAHQKGLELRLKLPDPTPWVLGERSRLEQIFVNLLSNAIKYTDKGFIEITVETADGAVKISVRDTGIGISEDEQGKLFQKFYRTDASLASREKGTGLGLAITRGLVEAHGGTVSVSSEPGKGSVFTVVLLTGAVFEMNESAPNKSGEELARALREIDEAREEQNHAREVTLHE